MDEHSLEDIKFAEYNPRQISKHDFDALKKSIDRFGDISGVVKNLTTGNLVGGHQRIRAFQQMQNPKIIITQRFETPTRTGTTAIGYVQVNGELYAYREVQWALDFEQAANVAANRIQGEWDDQALAELIYSMDEDMRKLTGHTEDEINKLLDSVSATAADGADDEAPELDEVNPPVSQLGEVYQLGSHRLMCGDSTNPDNVLHLTEDTIPLLMVTDPPYGVEYEPEWRDGADLGVGERSKGKVQNDDRVDWSVAYALFRGGVAYVWHAGVHAEEVASNLEENGFDIISQIIWAKQHFVMSRGDYHWQHEPCWYAVRKGNNHNWQGARDQSTLWEIKNNNSFGNGKAEETWGHGTQKPLECMARPIRNNSKRGESVYDPFGGSGTTLIAADKLERICYMMEIDPKYCDVIRKRYAKHVGREEDWQEATPIIAVADSPTPASPTTT